MLNKDITKREWVGTVISTDDPLKMFRCKIRIFGLFDDIEDDLIPWCFQKNSTTFAGGDGGFGSGSTPKVGHLVNVKFNTDIYSGEYYAIQNINETLRQEISDDYENVHILTFDEDEDLRVLYTQNQGFIMKLKDTLINVKNDNSIFITNPNGDSIELTNEGFLTIKTGDDITAETAKNLNIKCVNAYVDASTRIELGKGAVEALVQGTTFKTIFENHTHIGNLGAPTSPAKTMNWTVPLSILSYTK